VQESAEVFSDFARESIILSVVARKQIKGWLIVPEKAEFCQIF
jgi:hypothetical protein